jgi:DNA gyrase subunit A
MTDTALPALSPIVTIEDEMRRSYLDYAMSVIVSRALPDARDGLKPVHRRILFAMKEGGYTSDKPTRKSARIVGEVLGKFHPHGDVAAYDALVRMAQDFSMRLTLVDGQGNFGSIDGDPPAAMRYTESRLTKAAEALLEDIDKETVLFQPNYDGQEQEPTVLPARIPNLLVNGAGGIAVGMATNIPTHNLHEVVQACLAYIDNPEISVDHLMEYVPGPDFPTAGLILGKGGIRQAYHTGRGSIMMRGRTHTEEIRNREAIVVTEIPYQVNKQRLIERMAELVHDKTIEGIADLRDESDRDGMRIVIECKRDAVTDVVLNQLYKHTPLQSSFGINMLALHHGRPETMTLRDMIAAFIEFREEVITKRTIYDLARARERAHILIGLAVAVANLDPVIELIRKAPDPNTAREQLIAQAWPASDIRPIIELINEQDSKIDDAGNYYLTEAQAKAILDLRLHRLTGLERHKIVDDLKALALNIEEYITILNSRDKLLEIMRAELIEVREKFGTPRKTELVESEFEEDIEELIAREDMVVTVTSSGYVKRTPLATYRAQRRGGKGRTGMAMKDEDAIHDMFVSNTHTPILFFSTRGIAYKLKVWKLPLGTPQGRGKALVNIFPLQEGETISTVLALPEDEKSWDKLHLMFATSTGNVRRNLLSDFVDVRANGKIAMKLEEEGERLIGVAVCREDQDVMLAARDGKAIRFAVSDVRVFASRNSTGVRGIKLGAADEVVSLSIIDHIEADAEERSAYLKRASAERRAGDETEEAAGDEEATADIALSDERYAELAASEQLILTVTSKGFGKRSSAYDYRITGRGGQGIVNNKDSKRNGTVVATLPVTDAHQIMLVTSGGQVIRCAVTDIRICSRSSLGVTIFRVGEGEDVVSVAAVIEGEATETED